MSNGSAAGLFLLSLCFWIFLIRWIIVAGRRKKCVTPPKNTRTTPGIGLRPPDSTRAGYGTSPTAGKPSDGWYDYGIFNDGHQHHDPGHSYSDPGHHHN
jgi:hypothetical protein